jgi:hypothetical protein
MTAPKRSLVGFGRLSIRRISPAALYDAWRFAETEATLALSAWRDARHSDKGVAYATYVAALEAEAEPASLLQIRLAPDGA